MRYLDTGSRDPGHTVRQWLQQRLPNGQYFACQTGYFSRDGLEPFEADLRSLLATGGHFHLVVGSNAGSVLSADLDYVLDVIEGYDHQASLTLVGAADVLMHPKTFYLETRDNVRHALVGSANLTGPGLAGNIEAALAVSSDTDTEAPYDEIRDAILAWRHPDRANARPVTKDNLAEFVTMGATDAPVASKPTESPDRSSRRRQMFPPLGWIFPRHRRAQPSPEQTAEEAEETFEAVGQALPLPGGAVGIVKRLSSLDTKAFRGERGTPYIALPSDLAAYLPMSPYGRNGEPRVDIDLVARQDSLPRQVFTHIPTRSSASVTYVGMGLRVTSHPDLRLNFLMPIVHQLLDATAAANVLPPEEGDIGLVEFTSTTSVQIIFVTQEPLKRQLSRLLGADGWGWLPAQQVPVPVL